MKGNPQLFPHLTGTFQLSNQDTLEVVAKGLSLWAKTSKEDVLLKPDGAPGLFSLGTGMKIGLFFA